MSLKAEIDRAVLDLGDMALRHTGFPAQLALREPLVFAGGFQGGDDVFPKRSSLICSYISLIYIYILKYIRCGLTQIDYEAVKYIKTL